MAFLILYEIKAKQTKGLPNRSKTWETLGFLSIRVPLPILVQQSRALYPTGDAKVKRQRIRG